MLLPILLAVVVGIFLVVLIFTRDKDILGIGAVGLAFGSLFVTGMIVAGGGAERTVIEIVPLAEVEEGIYLVENADGGYTYNVEGEGFQVVDQIERAIGDADPPRIDRVQGCTGMLPFWTWCNNVQHQRTDVIYVPDNGAKRVG